MTPPDQTVNITSADGTALHAGIWSVAEPRGVLIIAHGLGEHGGGYEHVATAVRDRAGMVVIAFDFRGHGRSAGARGVVDKYEDFLSDLDAVLTHVRTAWPGLKVFVLGHSNGGQVVLRAVVAEMLKVDGVILSNPSLRLAKAVEAWKLGVGRLLKTFAPKVTMGSDIDLNELTRDQAMIEGRRLDPLRHSRINAALFFGLVEGADLVHRGARAIKLPLLLLIGGSDPIIDPNFTRQVFEDIGSTDKTLWIDPAMLHEPLNELGREVPIGVLIDWLIARV